MIIIIMAAMVLALAILYAWATSGSLPQNKFSEVTVFAGAPPPPAEPPGEKQTFIVMTYNIGYLSGMYNNQATQTTKDLFQKNMQTTLQFLESVKPDIIGFQEIDFNSKRSYYIDQLATIAEKTGYNYGATAVNWDKHYVPFPYWPPSAHFGKILSGQAVLSRWPILSTERIVLGKPGNRPFYYNAFYLDRLIQVVKIKIAAKDLILLNVHLEAFDRATREKQARKLLEIYRTFKDHYPVLVIGDFNSVPPDAPQKNNFPDEPGTDFSGENTIQLLLAEKSLRMAGPAGFTFPSIKPTRKLDYIFYNYEKITPIDSWAATGIDGSDHLPLLMKFTLTM